MIIQTTYFPDDFERGKCTSCSEESDEIVIGDGRCAECLEAHKFEEMTMKQFDQNDDVTEI